MFKKTKPASIVAIYVGKLDRPLTTWDVLLLTTCDWDFPWCFGWKAAFPSPLLWVVGLRCEGRAARVLLNWLAMIKRYGKVGADDCGEAAPLASTSFDVVRAENRLSFLARPRTSCTGLVPASPARGSSTMDWRVKWRQYWKEVEMGRLTAMWFLKLFNCDMRIEAEALMLVEGLHDQVQCNSVCLVLWWRKVVGRRKKRRKGLMARFTTGLFDRNLSDYD